jgi:hypothetical protein
VDAAFLFRNIGTKQQNFVARNAMGLGFLKTEAHLWIAKYVEKITDAQIRICILIKKRAA